MIKTRKSIFPLFCLALLAGKQEVEAQEEYTFSNSPSVEAVLLSENNPDISLEESVEDSAPLNFELAGSFTLGSNIFLDPHMLATNASTALSGIELALSPIYEIEAEGIIGILQRSATIGGNFYGNIVLTFLPHHELWHFGEGQTANNDPRLDLSGWLALEGYTIPQNYQNISATGITLRNGQFIRTDFNGENHPLPAERMLINGAGVRGSIMLSREIFTRAVDQGWSISDALAYIQGHSDILMYFPGEIDFENYSRSSFLNRYFPYNPDDRRWEGASRSGVREYFAPLRNTKKIPAPEYQAALYNYHQYILHSEYGIAPNPHQRSVALVSGLVNPHTWNFVYQILDYIFTGDRKVVPLPSWVPEVNGYWGVPGPYYEAAWYVPIQGGVLTLDARLSPSPELSAAVGMHLVEFPLPGGFDISVGGELISQQDGTIPFNETTTGGTAEAALGLPIGSNLIIRPYFLWQSEGVWSPRRFSMNEDLTIGTEVEVVIPR